MVFVFVCCLLFIQNIIKDWFMIYCRLVGMVLLACSVSLFLVLHPYDARLLLQNHRDIHSRDIKILHFDCSHQRFDHQDDSASA
jgi:hypothetical protein